MCSSTRAVSWLKYLLEEPPELVLPISDHLHIKSMPVFVNVILEVGEYERWYVVDEQDNGSFVFPICLDCLEQSRH